MSVPKPREPRLGHHGYSGACAPGVGDWTSHKTFSVGVFKWVSGAKGLKRSKVVYRISGPMSAEQAVYDRAAAVCDLLDAGLVFPTKSERVTLCRGDDADFGKQPMDDCANLPEVKAAKQAAAEKFFGGKGRKEGLIGICAACGAPIESGRAPCCNDMRLADDEE